GWVQLALAAYAQLRIASTLASDLRRPWHPKPEPDTVLSPYRTRLGFRRLRAQLGCPAQSPKFSRPGPGRPKGSKNQPKAPAHPTARAPKRTPTPHDEVKPQAIVARATYGDCMDAVQVVVAEDSLLVRAGVTSLLSTEPGVEVIGTVSSYDELLTCVDATPPHVVVTDIRMPPTCSDEGIRAASRLRRTHPSVGVVVLSQYLDPSYLLTLIEE